MNQTSTLFLSLILVSLLFCNFSWASDVCGDGAGYPDQYPFKNCGSVSTLTWDHANSCEELGDNSSCMVSVAGGQGPYTWTISGTGFSFASGQTSIQTSENTVTVFTQDACGAGSITVSDGCGVSVEGFVRSSRGHWVAISPNTEVTGLKAVPHTDFEHIYTCIDANNVWCMTYSSSGPTYEGIGENGRYRVGNFRYHKYYGDAGDYNSCNASACSSDPPGYGHLEDVPGFPYDWCWYFNPYGNPPFYRCDYIKYRWVQEWQCN